MRRSAVVVLLLLFASLAPVVRGACVTFAELVANTTRVSCELPHPGNRTSYGLEDTCTACRRLCEPGVPVEECVTILGDDGECPAAAPVPNTRCATPRVCEYDPYCGSILWGGAKRCMFLARAECLDGRWAVATAGAPEPRNPTCGEVERAFVAQRCCNAPDQPFLLDALLDA